MAGEEQLNQFLKIATEALDWSEIQETRNRAAFPDWNPFDWGANALPRRDRTLLRGDRYSKLAIGSELIRDIFSFVTRKDPQQLEQGFGNLVIDRKTLKRLVRMDPNKEEAIRNIARIMQYTNSTISIERKLGGGGAFGERLSMNAPAKKYLDHQARNAYEIIEGWDGDKSFLERTSKALILDIETSGLDESASTWQIAMRYKEGGQDITRDIRMKSALMDVGPQVDPKTGKLLSFEDLMALKNTPDAEFLDMRTGYMALMEQIDRTETIVGQNVSFDLNKLYQDLRKMRGAGFGDDFDELFEKVAPKLRGEGVRVVDTRQLLALLGGPLEEGGDLIVPGATAAIADFKTYSQENIARQTNVVQQAIDRLGADFRERLVRSGLHDARVDIEITNQILISLANKTLAKATKPLDADILQAIQSSAIVPTATLHKYGETTQATALEALIRGTSEIEPYSYNPLSNKMLTAGSIFDWRDLVGNSGLNEGVLARYNEVTGSKGFLDAGFAREIDFADLQTAMSDITGQKQSGQTIQELYEGAQVPFARISLPERLITNMLGDGVTIGTEAQSAVSSLMGGNIGGLYASGFSEYKGMPVGFFRNTAINTELLKAYEIRKDTILGQGAGGNARVARLSTVRPEDGPRVTLVLDAFKSETEAKNFVAELKAWHKELADQVKADKVLTEGDQRIFDMLEKIDNLKKREVEILDEAGKTRLIGRSGFGRLEDQLVENWKYGIQIGQYEGDNVAAVAQTLDQLFPGRDLEVTKMGTIVEDLAPGTMRTGAVVYDVEGRLGRGIKSSASAAFEGMKHLEEKFATLAGRQSALAIAKGGTISNYIAKNPMRVLKGAGAVAAVGAAAFFFRDEQKDERLEEPFRVTGYESAQDYEQYKASIGETAMPGFQSMPVSTMDPMMMSGAVQYLHDTKTRRHQMGANKNAHLFGL